MRGDVDKRQAQARLVLGLPHAALLQREAVADEPPAEEDERVVHRAVLALQVFVQRRRVRRPYRLDEARPSRLEALASDVGARAA